MTTQDQELREPADAAVQRSDSSWTTSYATSRDPNTASQTQILVGRALCERDAASRAPNAALQT